MAKDIVKLGELITEPEFRDAVHMAVIPVFANDDLEPGQHVGVYVSNDDKIWASIHEKYVGIVARF